MMVFQRGGQWTRYANARCTTLVGYDVMLLHIQWGHPRQTLPRRR